MPETVDPRAAGCPNRNWTALVDEVFLQTAVLTLTQGRDSLTTTFDLD